MFTWVGIFSALKNVARPPNGLLTHETFVTKLVGDVPGCQRSRLWSRVFFLIYTDYRHRAFNLFLEYVN